MKKKKNPYFVRYRIKDRFGHTAYVYKTCKNQYSASELASRILDLEKESSGRYAKLIKWGLRQRIGVN
ncbi:MAG: hypothetical protein J1F32_01840 [Erysipelotrichales bacterium]|nr:hypothetical protein [Erysipelotrichales bacterium]